jgi:apolipoprotein D and lipocalin family protein
LRKDHYMKIGYLFAFTIGPVIVCSFLNGCFTSAENSTESIRVVKKFYLDRYLGRWYEIARLPHSFEKGLDSVTASYSIREDGMIKVVNRGFDTSKGEWKEAVGKAYIPDTSAGALLKVSFFWFFYADYKVIALDTADYSYAMVTSSSKEYLWILSRSPVMEENVYSELLKQAAECGFKISDLYKVKQPR